jgi:hypothetical protein
LELYTEGEFVFDMKDSENDYFYSWSELTVSPTDWFFAGIAAQRTKVREDASDVEWGPMLGFAHKNIEWAIYAFEPGTDAQTLASSFTVHF